MSETKMHTMHNEEKKKKNETRSKKRAKLSLEILCKRHKRTNIIERKKNEFFSVSKIHKRNCVAPEIVATKHFLPFFCFVGFHLKNAFEKK